MVHSINLNPIKGKLSVCITDKCFSCQWSQRITFFLALKWSSASTLGKKKKQRINNHHWISSAAKHYIGSPKQGSTNIPQIGKSCVIVKLIQKQPDNMGRHEPGCLEDLFLQFVVFSPFVTLSILLPTFLPFILSPKSLRNLYGCSFLNPGTPPWMVSLVSKQCLFDTHLSFQIFQFICYQYTH